MKRLALLSGCLLLLACSDGDGGANTGQGGQAGGNAGSSGSGRGGTTGGGGSTGGGGNTGIGGQVGGNTGSGGQVGGSTGSGGQTGGTTGSAGRGGTTGGGGQTGGSTGNAGRGGSTGGGGGQAGGSTGGAGRGGNTGGGGQAGGGTGGSGGATCTQLASDYNRAMLDAEMCNAALTVVQCTEMATSMLACGCPIFVNDRTELDTIKARWDAMGCGAAIICPAIACPQPVRGGCTAIGRGDVCITQTASAGGG